MLGLADLAAKLSAPEAGRLIGWREGDRLEEWSLTERTIPGELSIDKRVWGEDLAQWEKHTLQVILDRFGAHPFDPVKLEQAAEEIGIAGAEIRRGLSGLKEKQMVFAFRKAWGEYIYALPWELARLWHRKIARPGAVPLSSDTFGAPLAETSYGRGLLFDLFYFLRYLASNEIHLTKKGTVPKRHLQKIDSLLTVDAAALRPLSYPYVHCDIYNESLVLVLDASLRLGLAVMKDGELKLCRERAADWLKLSTESMRRILYAYWVRISFPYVPSWQHQVIWLIERIPVNRQGRLGDILDVLRDCRPLSEEERKQEFHAESVLALWLKPLAELGLVDLAECGTDAEETCFRWTFTPDLEAACPNGKAEADKCYVQPDFEIVVPPGVPFRTRWMLEAMCERQQSDQVAVYRLSKESMNKALAEGYDLEQCMGCLRDESLYGLPDNVAQMIMQWTAREARTEMENKESEGTGAHSAVSPEYVNESDGGVRNEGAAYFSFLTVNGPGLILSDYAWDRWPIDCSIPSADELYPGWREVPLKWFRECHSYHLSTRKEMISRALEWKAALRLASSSEEVLLVPIRILDSEGKWRVAGRTQTSACVVDPQEWEQIQIILPEISKGSSS
ncbi:helicase-associated domain-containing protein [Paenibacillus sp. 32O-W]|uniref:helicase-associated domain-containing protein n=1 Tax=Paenibacillus sp. 32O-W TaxID=1695218 RepID=UPI0011A68455|nr:helicase-associated domain-containing protein [Paenibacillus sp. 32O-W]